MGLYSSIQPFIWNQRLRTHRLQIVLWLQQKNEHLVTLADLYFMLVCCYYRMVCCVCLKRLGARNQNKRTGRGRNHSKLKIWQKTVLTPYLLVTQYTYASTASLLQGRPTQSHRGSNNCVTTSGATYWWQCVPLSCLSTCLITAQTT